MNLLVINQSIPIQYILHPKMLKNRILLTLSNIMSALLHMKLRDLPQTTHQNSLLLHTALKSEILTQTKGIFPLIQHQTTVTISLTRKSMNHPVILTLQKTIRVM